MDTRLKRYSVICKVLALILIVAASCYTMLTLTKLKEPVMKLGSVEDLFARHYTETLQYHSQCDQLYSKIHTILHYKSEENILDGNTVSPADIDAQVLTMFYDRKNFIEQKFYNAGVYTLTQKMLWDRFQEDYQADIANVKNTLTQKHLEDYRDAVNTITNNPNLQYFINVDGAIMSNHDLASINNSEYRFFDGEFAYSQVPDWNFAFHKPYIDEQNAKFLAIKHEATGYIIQGSIGLLLMLLSLAYLIFAAGKKAAEPQGVYHLFVDKLYNEITLFLLFISFCAVLACGAAILQNIFHQAYLFVLLTGSVLLAVALLLILVRHIKSHTLLKHTLIFSASQAIFKTGKKAFNAGPPMVKALALVAVMGLLTAIPLVFLITLPLAMAFTYKQVIKYLAVKDGIQRIKSGSYQQKIEVQGTGEIALLAAEINDISAGLGMEVERRLKSERLKTELIVNVSHDIKTPLTSVITYVDLLKKEDIPNENARNYINVIAKKSERLKVLIDDLFDASKAASGNVPVHCEDVEINALITQGLGELDDKIKSSSLDFKVNLPQTKVTAYADGRLLWRVLENLLDNVFKYSLAQSRVYLDVFEDERFAYIELKNISAAELNIPEDEVTERFKRGDESRSSEGSGLGLDIAKSLMVCQNGELLIKIDGDLFKAKLRIPKTK